MSEAITMEEFKELLKVQVDKAGITERSVFFKELLSNPYVTFEQLAFKLAYHEQYMLDEQIWF